MKAPQGQDMALSTKRQRLQKRDRPWDNCRKRRDAHKKTRRRHPRGEKARGRETELSTCCPVGGSADTQRQSLWVRQNQSGEIGEYKASLIAEACLCR